MNKRIAKKKLRTTPGITVFIRGQPRLRRPLVRYLGPLLARKGVTSMGDPWPFGWNEPADSGALLRAVRVIIGSPKWWPFDWRRPSRAGRPPLLFKAVQRSERNACCSECGGWTDRWCPIRRAPCPAALPEVRDAP